MGKEEDEWTKVDGNSINTVIIGDEGVGKTSIINCYVNDEFHPEYIPSMYNQFKVEIENHHPEYCQEYNKITLNISDFSGKEGHKSLRQLSYKKADIILLCYNSSDGGQSVHALESKWL